MLALTFALTVFGVSLPPGLSGLSVYGPYAVLGLAGIVSFWFNRGRAFFGLLCLAVAYVSYRWLMPDGDVSQPGARIAFTALCVFLPANLAAFSWMAERGLFNAFGLRRLLAIAVQVAFTLWLMNTGAAGFADWVAERRFAFAWLQASPIPQGALLVMLLGLTAATACALLHDAPIEAALAGTIVAFGLAAHNAHHPSVFGLYICCGALLLAIGVLQKSYRMAFQDELTGLPGRRALDERLMGLGRRYALAMVDVDDFKRFNDQYGHALGDQVLKMVATKLARLRLGGRAFRYGGEEFTLVFPRRHVRELLPELERVRTEIAQHRLAVRTADRPVKAKVGRRQRTKHGADPTVAVTVSIGVAESNEKLSSPEAVLRSADQALYRAKERGKNRVNR